jgi:hypothetical protein
MMCAPVASLSNEEGPMKYTELLVGAALMIGSIWSIWVSMPVDGKVRSFLQNDQVQAYYAVALLVGFLFGVVNVVAGLIAMMG